MGERDERVVNALRELVDRAPADAEVWAETERHLVRHKHRRQAAGAAAAIAVLSAFAVAGALSADSKDRVRVATATPATTTSPVTAAPATVTASSTTTTETPATTPTVDSCPAGCVGRATADVDGDGRPDQIGLFASPPLSGDITAGRPSHLIVRVVMADGRVAEYNDTAEWDASLVGANDVNGDGKAEIFYFNHTGANLHSGYILYWDDTKLVAVQGSDGKPFNTFTSGYAMGGDGFRCSGNSFMTMTIGYGAPPDGWSAEETTYRWRGDQLVKVAENQPIGVTQPPAGPSGQSSAPPEYDQIIGAHCPGLSATYPKSIASMGP
jgi:hypothetical protein